MSKESYARGFCKAAEAAGVDPVALAEFTKYASPLGLLAKAMRGPSIRNALRQGKIILSKAPSLKDLIKKETGGFRGARAYGYPLPAYAPTKGGREKALLDARDLIFPNYANGHYMDPSYNRFGPKDRIDLLRQLNGSDVPGPQLRAAKAESAGKFKSPVNKPAGSYIGK